MALGRTLTITVMLGGRSAEREVSLRTGRAVAAALRRRGHRVFELDPVSEDWTLPEGTEVVFLALHGTYGEDGQVQARLEALGVPYTGCGPEASRAAFDKAEAKRLFLEAGLATPLSAVVESPDAPPPERLRWPLVLKPTRQGSSVGLAFASGPSDWPRALGEAWRAGPPVLAEEFIRGREVTVGVLAGEALPVVEIVPRSGRYDYQSKYTTGATEYRCPADFPEETTRRIQAAGRRAFQAVGGRDYARVDLIVAADGQPWVLEVNTLPGMTETSLLPKAAAAAGIGFDELCERMIELAMRRGAPQAPGA
ncbi:MAG: D-alanine--D-alanine ligase [Verrucomicrobia bacterium]|nr:MAG: D-alanine--D-alanine ligase [Verrucomicrobiota bacterium]